MPEEKSATAPLVATTSVSARMVMNPSPLILFLAVTSPLEEIQAEVTEQHPSLGLAAGLSILATPKGCARKATTNCVTGMVLLRMAATPAAAVMATALLTPVEETSSFVHRLIGAHLSPLVVPCVGYSETEITLAINCSAENLRQI
jgi:hypothetical protein